MMKFDWDPDKAAVNEQKHSGVTFEEACEAFDDDYAIVEVDEAHSFGERRYRLIGASSQRLLLVVYVEQRGDIIRIISARIPESHEKEQYYADE
jgi:uncharacterized protein